MDISAYLFISHMCISTLQTHTKYNFLWGRRVQNSPAEKGQPISFVSHYTGEDTGLQGDGLICSRSHIQKKLEPVPSSICLLCDSALVICASKDG